VKDDRYFIVTFKGGNKKGISVSKKDPYVLTTMCESEPAPKGDL
jgi:hypothetical protein